MAKRQIKDALVNGESVYFKGHAQATYMSSGITVEDAINNIGTNIDLTNYATKTYVDNALLNKQNIISDLETIRSGSALGNTAVQPAAIDDMETKTNAAATYLPIGDYATKTEIPTKVSQLENDSNYITASDLNAKQDTLVSGTNIKTINGESILGSGNITISGGSSGGSSGAYAEVNHGTSDTTFTLTPNTFHVWDEVASLDLSFADETAGVANEYLFQFTSGATATTLTLPDVKWTNDSAPTIAENMIYQISVLKGLASMLEFSNAAALIENHGTYTAGTMASGATLTFEYPVASDLTINLQYGDTAVIPKGQSSITIDWIEPAAPTIKSIIPSQDDTYIYII